MKKATILFCCTMLVLIVHAQVSSKSKEKKEAKRQKVNQILRLEEEGEAGFRKHSIVGVKFNTDGYGFSYEYGKPKSAFKTTLFQIEFNEKKHRKEQKQSRSTGSIVFGNPFIYGKQNFFYQMKLGAGQQIMIGGKGNKNGVAVYGIYGGGLTMGLLRPYYVDIQDPPSSGKVIQIKYSATDSLKFMGPEILGSSGLTKGWKEMTISPGIHAKAALRFDWGRFNNTISAIETGFNFEYYTKDVKQMVGIEPRKFFVNGYITLLFGSRK